MATAAYTTGLREIMDGTIDWEDATDIYVMLLANDTTYTYDPDHTYVDMSGASDPVDAELSVTGYVGGWGGAGRKALTSKTLTEYTTTDLVTFDAADPSAWTLTAGETVVAAIIFKNGAADDTTSRLLFYVDFTDTATNGGSFTLSFNASGIVSVDVAP